MSKMQELYKKVSGDNALQLKFEEIMRDAEAAGEEATKAKLLSFAKEAGYDVTLEEMQTFFKELADMDQNELTDGELDNVAGGKSLGWVIFSAFTLGVACGVASIFGAVYKDNCDKIAGEMFDQEWQL